MTLVNCRECGKLITSESDNLCKQCITKREADMIKVRDCIRLNSNISIKDLSANTGIPTDRLLQFIREGLIECKVI